MPFLKTYSPLLTNSLILGTVVAPPTLRIPTQPWWLEPRVKTLSQLPTEGREEAFVAAGKYQCNK